MDGFTDLTKASVALSEFLSAKDSHQINLKELRERYLNESDAANKEKARQNLIDEGFTGDFETEIDNRVEDIDNEIYDRFEAMADGLEKLIDTDKASGEKIGDFLDKDEVDIALQTIKNFDGNEDEISIPQGDSKIAEAKVESSLSEDDRKSYIEQNLFATFFRQEDQTTDINSNYVLGVSDYKVGINKDLDADNITIRGETGTPSRGVPTHEEANLDNNAQAFYAEYTAGISELRSKGLRVNEAEYVKFFIDMAEKLPFGENNIRFLMNEFMSNMAGTVMLRDPNDPIYATWYLPASAQKLKTVRLLFATLISQRINLEARTISARTLLNDRANDNSVDLLITGDTNENFNIEIFLGGPDETDSLSEPLQNLRIHIEERYNEAQERGETYTWANAQSDAIRFDIENDNSIGLAEAIQEDTLAYNLVTFRDVVSQQLDVQVDNLESKLQAAKALGDYIRTGLKQPEIGRG